MIMAKYKRAAGSIRAESKPLKISGFAYRFGDQGFADGMKETIEPGAFRGLSDAMLLLNHNPELPLGRAGKNMELRQTDKGLEFSAELPNTERGKEIYALAKAGILSGVSVGMRQMDAIEKDGRRVIKSAELEEISLTHRPVYSETTLEARHAKQNPVIYPPECI